MRGRQDEGKYEFLSPVEGQQMQKDQRITHTRDGETVIRKSFDCERHNDLRCCCVFDS